MSTTTTNAALKPVYVDRATGQFYETKAELLDAIRRPQVLEALGAIEGSNEGVANFLLDSKDAIEGAFAIGGIRRVTKSEHTKLDKALAHIAEVLKGDAKAEFVLTHADAIRQSFKWPTVTRMKEDEIAAAAKASVMALNANEAFATWVLNSREAITAAYKAGIVVPQVSEAAKLALEKHRAAKAAAKAEAEAQKRGTDADASGTPVAATDADASNVNSDSVDPNQF